MLIGPAGTALLPKTVFGLFERFGTFSVVVFNTVFGISLMKGTLYFPAIGEKKWTEKSELSAPSLNLLAVLGFAASMLLRVNFGSYLFCRLNDLPEKESRQMVAGIVTDSRCLFHKLSAVADARYLSSRQSSVDWRSSVGVLVCLFLPGDNSINGTNRQICHVADWEQREQHVSVSQQNGSISDCPEIQKGEHHDKTCYQNK